jgi:hypothetical protein
MILQRLHEKLASLRALLLGLTMTHRSGAVVFGILLLATGCRAQTNDSASSELIRAHHSERSVPELICLIQFDELEIPADNSTETLDLPRCNSKIRDEFLSKLSLSNSGFEQAARRVDNVPAKGTYYRGFLPGIPEELFLRRASHGRDKVTPTHYLHPVTGHWMEI